MERGQDPGELADDMEREADQLEDRSEELGHEVDEVRKDWERKRSDQSVPGANPPDEDDQTSGQGSDVPPDREAGQG